jgi:vacuolar-type H+-ATPase subunit D/Vma8
MDFATIRPFWESFSWLLNGYGTDDLFSTDSPSEDDECQQHWETVKKYLGEISALKGAKERISFLKQELDKAQQYRSNLLALSIPNFEDQIRELKMALNRFDELAEF